jgi:hypothetical protein
VTVGDVEVRDQPPRFSGRLRPLSDEADGDSGGLVEGAKLADFGMIRVRTLARFCSLWS